MGIWLLAYREIDLRFCTGVSSLTIARAPSFYLFFRDFFLLLEEIFVICSGLFSVTHKPERAACLNSCLFVLQVLNSISFVLLWFSGFWLMHEMCSMKYAWGGEQLSWSSQWCIYLLLVSLLTLSAPIYASALVRFPNQFSKASGFSIAT
jgi:hypothetical protein